MEYFSLHPGLPLSTSNNQIKSQYSEFSTDSIRFQFAIGSTFGRNFSPPPHTWHCYQCEIPIHHNNQC